MMTNIRMAAIAIVGKAATALVITAGLVGVAEAQQQARPDANGILWQGPYGRSHFYNHRIYCVMGGTPVLNVTGTDVMLGYAGGTMVAIEYRTDPLTPHRVSTAGAFCTVDQAE